MTANPWRRIHTCVPRLVVAVMVALTAGSVWARSIVDAGPATVWRYADDAPPTGWQKPGFDDSKWHAGKAPLGYGEARVGTDVHPGPATEQKPVTTYFRREFDAPDLAPGQQLVILVCTDDGAVIYLNGHELGRANMPPGPVAADTPALHEIDERGEGFYHRLRVPAKAIKPGKNVLAAEVHKAAPAGTHLFFDLALKTLPVDDVALAVPDDARQVVDEFNKHHYLGPEVHIPDGYADGGRHMKIDGDRHPTSGREILLVDRAHDVELAADLAFARSPELRALPPLERIARLAERIDRETTPPGGLQWVGKTAEQLQKEFTNKPVLIGDWVDQCQGGVCRHRSLLFKILADEAGLKTALVRGNHASGKPPSIPHAWNEVFVDDGRRVLVDVMLKRDKQTFPEVNSPEVVKHYLKVDDTPWYTLKAE